MSNLQFNVTIGSNKLKQIHVDIFDVSFVIRAPDLVARGIFQLHVFALNVYF